MSAIKIVLARFTVGGVLADPTSMLLNDPTGTYGIRRTDTGEIIVPAGTAMTNTNVGLYQFTFTGVAGVTYEWYAQSLYLGAFIRDYATWRCPVAGEVTLTGQDLVYHVMRYLANSNADVDEDTAQSAVVAAVYRLATDHPWRSLQDMGRIITSEPYTTGTVTIDALGVDVTFAGGATVPTWAVYGELTVGGVPGYRITSRDSDTEVTLLASTPFGETAAAAADYILQRPYYNLPDRFRIADHLHHEESWALRWVSLDRIVRLRRREEASSGQEFYAAIIGDRQSAGTLQVVLYPTPSDVRTLDFPYIRWPADPSADWSAAIDMDVTACREVLYRACELQADLAHWSRKGKADVTPYQEALTRAKGADRAWDGLQVMRAGGFPRRWTEGVLVR